MSHRDNFIKTNKEYSEPLDIFNTGFVGTVGGSAPDIPAAPTASVSTDTVTISWTAPDAHGNAIDVYNVYRNGTYLKQVSTTSTTDTTGALGTSYVYAIDAHNVIGWSGVSPNSNAVIPSTVPSTPSTPSASTSNGTSSISWSASSANGAAIDYYHVYRNGSYLKQVGSTSTTDSTGTIGTGYYYSVKAHNANGFSSLSGNSSTVTPSTVPSAPTIGTAVDNVNGTITVNWSAATANGNAVTNYQIYVNGANLITVGNVTTYVHTIVSGNSYYYKVKATNTNGYGAFSADSNTVQTSAVSGGYVSTYNGYTVRRFTHNSNLVLATAKSIEVVLVGGGGGGGGQFTGGGGGAGAVIQSVAHTLAAGTYTPSIGSGGAGGTTAGQKYGLSGNQTTFRSMVAPGGLGGTGRYNQNSGALGSNGGGAGAHSVNNVYNTQSINHGGVSGTGSSSSWNANLGGIGRQGGSSHSAGGGSGANYNGSAASSSQDVGGNGGDGVNVGFLSASNYYGGGGGGGSNSNGSAAATGGLGGGGAGGRRYINSGQGSNGTGNTGGGGGGNGHGGGTYQGATGGSGVFLVRHT